MTWCSSALDSHASRAVVGQAAYQYLVPAIDMGVSISVAEGLITHITGRVQLLAPGQPCLSCTGALDGEQIRRELLTPSSVPPIPISSAAMCRSRR